MNTPASPVPVKKPAPLAISMWDFSWLERRWPGAGYEDWAVALDELAERGYNAVRIDAYPHLVGSDPEREWTLVPVWDQNDWGSPGVLEVRVQPLLNQFIAVCRERGIKVGLSSWFRDDLSHARLRLTTAEAMADAWARTLRTIAAAGLLDSVLYVDLCNEWPGTHWSPFFRNDPPECTWGWWHTETSMRWMKRSIELLRAEFPDLPLLYSFDGMDDDLYRNHDLSHTDLIEHHCWMAKENDGEFAKTIGYDYNGFSPKGYIAIAENASRVYRERASYWRNLLTTRIASLASASRDVGLPLGTTECWGIVDYKDWPRLDWGWVKELCELGTLTAVQTGRWAIVATSNFCGPQFRGMWRDVEWHRRLTTQIKAGAYPQGLRSDRLARRI
ncbi:MAG: cellulase-like family protein [Opitutaceae bacterium]|nr:cellulase-like family protein [Opitutaceae bacterium]